MRTCNVRSTMYTLTTPCTEQHLQLNIPMHTQIHQGVMHVELGIQLSHAQDNIHTYIHICTSYTPIQNSMK